MQTVKQFIPLIEVSNQEDLLVNARDLHKRLNINIRFNDWINRRINDFDFVQDQDFILFTQKRVKFGRRPKEYHITLDMAKELAMLERNEIGRKIRRYFIATEKEHRAKRMYGQVATLSELKKKVPTMTFNKKTLYSYRDCQRYLGYSTKSSISNVRIRFASQIGVINGKSYITEDYLKVIIARATARHQSTLAIVAPPLLPMDFGQLSFLGGDIL